MYVCINKLVSNHLTSFAYATFIKALADLTDENCTIVIDDMALQATTDTAQIFTVGSHHNRVNVIFICQKIFTKNDHFREMSLNATYLILFKNVRDKLQISTFAKQFLPGKMKEFAAIYCSIITLSGRKVELLRVITSCIAVCTSVLYVCMYQ